MFFKRERINIMLVLLSCLSFFVANANITLPQSPSRRFKVKFRITFAGNRAYNNLGLQRIFLEGYRNRGSTRIIPFHNQRYLSSGESYQTEEINTRQILPSGGQSIERRVYIFVGLNRVHPFPSIHQTMYLAINIRVRSYTANPTLFSAQILSIGHGLTTQRQASLANVAYSLVPIDFHVSEIVQDTPNLNINISSIVGTFQTASLASQITQVSNL